MAKAKAQSERIRLYRSKGKLGEKLELELTGKTLVTRAGSPQSLKETKKAYKTPALAKAARDAIVVEQREAGFLALGEVPKPTVPIARDPALEATIREDRDDPAPYLVYADWLQAHGCKLGELIVFAHANKKKQVAAIAKQLGMPAEDLATVGWRHGLWQWLRIDNRIDWMDGSFDTAGAARALSGSPLCCALDELRIGLLRWDETDAPMVIAEAGKQAWAKDLRRLFVGDIDDWIDMDHHAVGNVGKAITKAFPNLEWLKLHTGGRFGESDFVLDGLELPKLREFIVETCGLSPKRAKAIANAKLPALERLEVWFGEKSGGGSARTGDITGVLDGRFPKLRHLGLRNSELVTDFVRLVPASKLARQLESLDLSMGTMSDDDAGELAAAAKQLPKLTALHVGDSYLTKAGIRALKAAFPKVKIDSAAQREPYDFDPDARYVSVSE